jgi:hypothetical protein
MKQRRARALAKARDSRPRAPARAKPAPTKLEAPPEGDKAETS